MANKCIRCEQRAQDLYPCDSCKQLLCSPCAELTPEEVRCFSLRKRRLIFLCEQCENGFKQVPQLIKDVNDLRNEIRAMQTEGNRINKGPESYCNEEVIQEVYDRQTRSKNIIISNIKESAEKNRKERLADESSTIQGILDLFQIEETYSFKIQRLGKFHPDKTRLIKVMFPEESVPKLILKTKNKVQVPGVKIFADQTKLQRDTYRALKHQIKDDNTKTIKYINNIPRIVDKNNEQQKN